MAGTPLQDLLDSYVPSAGLPRNAAPGALHRLAWLMFVVAKQRLLPPQPDLVSLFHLLLAVVAALRDHAPWAADAVGDGAAEPADTLAVLAAAHKASTEEVRPAALRQRSSSAVQQHDGILRRSCSSSRQSTSLLLALVGLA
jgi:hypothetical protein